MIKVAQQPEYLGFNSNVRKPGNAFLSRTPTPSSKEIRKNNLWRHASAELHSAYSGICAYTAVYLPDKGTVDHFYPIASRPDLAYEWTNYRLASGKVNNVKSDQASILDPFQIEDGWFTLDIPSCLVRPGHSIEHTLRGRINSTIHGLRLNDDDAYVQERANILISYAEGEIGLQFLRNRYPFLAKEVARQGLDIASLRERFSLG